MYKKTIKYTDYDGEEREETFYFNLSKAEVLRTEMSVAGGYTELLKKIVKEKDNVKLYKMFEDIVTKSYGVKSDDGKRFIKSDEQTKAFMETEAYSEMIVSLFDADEAVKFITGIFPKDMTDKVDKKEIQKIVDEYN